MSPDLVVPTLLVLGLIGLRGLERRPKGSGLGSLGRSCGRRLDRRGLLPGLLGHDRLVDGVLQVSWIIWGYVAICVIAFAVALGWSE